MYPPILLPLPENYQGDPPPPWWAFLAVLVVGLLAIAIFTA